MSAAALENMVGLAGGSFRMGSERFYPEERPERDVEVGRFRIDRSPVTVGQFARLDGWARTSPVGADYCLRFRPAARTGRGERHLDEPHRLSLRRTGQRLAANGEAVVSRS